MKKLINRSAVTPLRCLAAMPPEGCMRAGILPGCPNLDRGSREAEVGFEPRTFRSVNSRSNHLDYLALRDENANLFIVTPISFERSSSCSGVIIPVGPHQRKALDSSFALTRAHQQCISNGRAGI
ncbi:hypothetical protein T265_08908 [Opisthorchis viverrini]|uniref:Uncharacterized protein n=1 Tax=Opisthorchis viverrini TaxID=6198 RepID=A0A074ZC14_OPIVI|nr:hypothetical protein T265_08908 [Opisthorchis viverrini]KER23137.1 hypothetical protein T265_08908 [Opisthorchis viverrini]